MEAFHVVFTTHNSRTSKRMIKYGVKKGPPIELGLEEEIALTQIFRDLILENNYKCLAYAILKDHIHLILVCERDKLVGIVQKLKSISSKLFHRLNIPMGHDPLEHKNHLWSQKFYHANLEVWQLNDNKTKNYNLNGAYLKNAIKWLKNYRNRKLVAKSEKLDDLINSFILNIHEVSNLFSE